MIVGGQPRGAPSYTSCYSRQAYEASMNLKQLEYFVRVASTGSFTKASTRLRRRAAGVEQAGSPTRSRSQAGALHAPRTGRGAHRRRQGRARHAQKIIEQVAEAATRPGCARKEVHGSVVIATAATTRQALTGFVSAFRARFPQASLEILEARSRVINEWLLEGRIDIGILLDAVPARASKSSGSSIRRCIWSRGPTRQPLAARRRCRSKALARLPLILPNQMNSIRTLVEMEARDCA